MEKAGVRIFRLQQGFLHYKAMLFDYQTGAIGTANFDNRSFRLNFEITLQVDDPLFAEQVERMFERDFANSDIASAKELRAKSPLFRLAVRTARLMAPIQ